MAGEVWAFRRTAVREPHAWRRIRFAEALTPDRFVGHLRGRASIGGITPRAGYFDDFVYRSVQYMASDEPTRATCLE
jgi:hypothetical protein